MLSKYLLGEWIAYDWLKQLILSSVKLITHFKTSVHLSVSRREVKSEAQGCDCSLWLYHLPHGFGRWSLTLFASVLHLRSGS